MSSVLNLGAPKVEALFNIGRSLACWQKELSRSVARQEMLAQACAWAGEFVKTPAPALEIGPLLGGCLAELVEFSTPTEEKTAELRPPRADKPAPASNRSRRPAGAGPYVPLRQAAAGKMPPIPKTAVAPTSLLRRWAGNMTVSPPHPSSPSRRPKWPLGGKQVTLPGNTHNLQEWPNPLFKRTRELLALDDKKAATFKSKGGPLLQPLNKWQKAALVNDNPPAGIETQWQQPLFGKMAPLAMLENLLASSVKAAKAADTSERTNPAASVQERHSRQTETAIHSNLMPKERTEATFSPTHLLEGGHSHLPENEYSGQRQGEVRNRSAEQSPRFAPPQVAETLPQLRALPKPGTTNLFPVASLTAERNARREAEKSTLSASGIKTEPAEDLDNLASQIKQILDEESRRHGIDV